MHSYSQSQETGAIRLLQPLSRAKEERMRVVRFLFLSFSLLASFLSLTVAAFAADLKVKVVDPQGAAVAGAQVSLTRAGASKVVAAQSTSAEGEAIFRVADAGPYRIQVLAP